MFLNGSWRSVRSGIKLRTSTSKMKTYQSDEQSTKHRWTNIIITGVITDFISFINDLWLSRPCYNRTILGNIGFNCLGVMDARATLKVRKILKKTTFMNEIKEK